MGGPGVTVTIGVTSICIVDTGACKLSACAGSGDRSNCSKGDGGRAEVADRAERGVAGV